MTSSTIMRWSWWTLEAAFLLIALLAAIGRGFVR
jgi:hypothetical protein